VSIGKNHAFGNGGGEVVRKLGQGENSPRTCNRDGGAHTTGEKRATWDGLSIPSITDKRDIGRLGGPGGGSKQVDCGKVF